MHTSIELGYILKDVKDGSQINGKEIVLPLFKKSLTNLCR